MDDAPKTEIVLYRTDDGRSRIQCRFQDESIWLTQALMAELFQLTVQTINEHLKGIYDDGELAPEATIRKFRIVRTEGNREVSRACRNDHPRNRLASGIARAVGRTVTMHWVVRAR